MLSPDRDRLPFHQVHQCLKDAHADFNYFMYIVIAVGIRISDGNISETMSYSARQYQVLSIGNVHFSNRCGMFVGIQKKYF